MTDPAADPPSRMVRGRFGAPMVALALAGLGIALYLSWARLSGEAPACGPLRGCETVDSSEYSVFLGIPMAFFGLGMAALYLLIVAVWWRVGDRRALVIAYLVGLVNLPVLAYLAYLEVAVIHAICIWCVGFAISVIGGWVLATAALAISRPGASAVARKGP